MMRTYAGDSKDKHIALERFLFNIELPKQEESSQSPNQNTELYWSQIEEELRAFLIRISLSDSQLPPIKPACQFQILMQVGDPAGVSGANLLLRQQSQKMQTVEPWISADATCERPAGALVVPLRSMNCVQYNSSDNSLPSFRMELVVEAAQQHGRRSE